MLNPAACWIHVGLIVRIPYVTMHLRVFLKVRIKVVHKMSVKFWREKSEL